MEEAMTQDGNDPNMLGLELVKEALESDPSKNRQALTRALHNEFMRVTGETVEGLLNQLGPLAQQQQGGARCSMETGEFGSHYGIVLPKGAAYPRLSGKLVGNELVMSIENDNVLCRLNSEAPDWSVYSIALEQLLTGLLVDIAQE